MTIPSDRDLMEWRKTSEDNFVERKTRGDRKDWLRAVVAFANSCPYERSAVLFIGVRNDRNIEPNLDVDRIEEAFRREVQKAYPPIRYQTRALSEGQDRYLAVIVAGSPDRPHFAGPAYVRVGSATRQASESEFKKLIAERNSKAYKICQRIGQRVTVKYLRAGRSAAISGRISGSQQFEVVDCDQFSVTLRAPQGGTQSFFLERLQIVEDHSIGEMFLEIAAS
jgi:hypothetical protein